MESNNGETIKFDSKGNLLDGQHRLSMVVKTGITMETHALFGVDSKGFLTLDSGKKRSAADALRLEGFKRFRHMPNAIQISEALLVGRYRLPTL